MNTGPTQCRGVRGATTVNGDHRNDVLLATGDLLWLLVEKNGIQIEDLRVCATEIGYRVQTTEPLTKSAWRGLSSEENDIYHFRELASAYFTTTRDIVSEYPALAARKLGWQDLALLCGHEMEVAHGVDHCIRVLLHWNTTKSGQEIKHIYLRGARHLRPDKDELVAIPEVPTAHFSLTE